eukprot:scaffold581_cov127-Skeletonema_marinoi.AAC.24
MITIVVCSLQTRWVSGDWTPIYKYNRQNSKLASIHHEEYPYAKPRWRLPSPRGLLLEVPSFRREPQLPITLTFTAHSGQIPSEAIAEAMKLSEELGATSNEARVAWKWTQVRITTARFVRCTTSWKIQIGVAANEAEASDQGDQNVGCEGSISTSTSRGACGSSTEATKAWDKLDSCFGSNADGVLEFSDECNIDSEPSSYRYSAAALKAHHLYYAAIDTDLLGEALEALGMLKGLTKFVNIEKRRLDVGVSVDFTDSD